MDLSASFRVKIDNKSNWHLKAVLNNERFKKQHHKYHHHHNHKLNRNLSQSSNNLDQANNIKPNALNKESNGAGQQLRFDLSAGGGVAANEMMTSILNKRKSSSTSYLNEEDDYDDDYYENSLGMSMNMKQYKQAQRLSRVLNESGRPGSGEEQKKQQTLSAQNSIEERDNVEVGTTATTTTAMTGDGGGGATTSAQSLSDIKSDSSVSSPSENSENEEDENDPDLYAIDEYEEVFPNLDYESSKLKILF